MAEKIETGCDGLKKWHWYNVQHDLVRGGLEEDKLMIDPMAMTRHGCGGKYDGNAFYFSWVKDKFLLVTSQEYNQKLTDAFSKVVEYQPFAKYTESDSGLITTEWDKIDPEGRYQSLQEEGKINLVKYSPK